MFIQTIELTNQLICPPYAPFQCSWLIRVLPRRVLLHIEVQEGVVHFNGNQLSVQGATTQQHFAQHEAIGTALGTALSR